MALYHHLMAISLKCRGLNKGAKLDQTEQNNCQSRQLQLFLTPVLANFENGRDYIFESIKRVFIHAIIIPFHLEDLGKFGDMSHDFLEMRPRAGPHTGLSSYSSLLMVLRILHVDLGYGLPLAF